MKWRRFAILLCAAALPGCAAEIAVSGGLGFDNQSGINTPVGNIAAKGSRGTVLIDAASKIIGIGPASISWDVPLAFGGPSSAEVQTVSPIGAAAYAQRLNWAFTPGLKARFGLGLVSPWVSFGAGGARLEQAGAAWVTPGLGSGTVSTGNHWVFAISPAAGIDFKPIPVLFLRGELRSYTFRTPSFDLLQSFNPFQNSWRNNIMFLGGIGVRF